MFPQSLVPFFSANQEALWLTTLLLDLGCTVVLYRMYVNRPEIGIVCCNAPGVVVLRVQEIHAAVGPVVHVDVDKSIVPVRHVQHGAHLENDLG